MKPTPPPIVDVDTNEKFIKEFKRQLHPDYRADKDPDNGKPIQGTEEGGNAFIVEPPPEKKKKDSMRELVLKVFKTKVRKPSLRPQHHEQFAVCYRCWHLSLPKAGRLYRQCQHYGMGIRATQSIRICKGFERQPMSQGLAPDFRCKGCRNLNPDRKCKVLNIMIKNLSENKYGLCPYWKSTFHEPMKHCSRNKPFVNKKDNQIKE